MIRTVIASALERAAAGMFVVGDKLLGLADRAEPIKITLIEIEPGVLRAIMKDDDK